MKLVAQAGDLADALSLATAAVRGGKKPAPTMHIVADTDTVSFTCCDPDIAIEVTAGADISKPGKVTVAAERMGGLIAALPTGSSIMLSTTENAMMITAGESRYRLPTLRDAPAAISIGDEIARLKISGSDLLHLFEVLPTAGTERTRFFLTGVHLHNNGDGLVAVATDGVKLLRVGIAAKHFSTDRRLIVPAKSATALAKLIRSTRPDKVTLRRSQTLFAVTGAAFSFTTRLIDAEYPDYERVLPHPSTSIAICSRTDMVEALARLDAVANSVLPLVALAWVDRGRVRLFLPQQPGDAEDAIAADARGSAQLAMSLTQFAAMITTFTGDRLHLEVAGVAGPLVLRGERSKFGMLMGCRWNFDENGPRSPR